MPATAQPVDIEELLVAYLTERGIAGGAVSTELPSTWTKGDQAVKVSRIGGTPPPGTIAGRLDRASIQFDAYHATPTEARTLAGATTEAIRRLIGWHRTGYGTITDARPTLGITWNPDPETDAARYLFGFTIYLNVDVTPTPWADLLDWTHAYDLDDPDITTDQDPGDGSLVSWPDSSPNYIGGLGILTIPDQGNLDDGDRPLVRSPGWIADALGAGTVPGPTAQLLTPDQLTTYTGRPIFGARRGALTPDADNFTGGLTIVNETNYNAGTWWPATALGDGNGTPYPYTLAAIIAAPNQGSTIYLPNPVAEFIHVFILGNGTTIGAYMAYDPDGISGHNPDGTAYLPAEPGGTGDAITTTTRVDHHPHLLILEVEGPDQPATITIDNTTTTGTLPPDAGWGPLYDLSSPKSLGPDPDLWTTFGHIAGSTLTNAERTALHDYFLDQAIDPNLIAHHRPTYRLTDPH